MVHVQINGHTLAGWPQVVHVAAGPSDPERYSHPDVSMRSPQELHAACCSLHA